MVIEKSPVTLDYDDELEIAVIDNSATEVAMGEVHEQVDSAKSESEAINVE